MKYYIKVTNTETGKSMVMSIPVFTSRKKAQEFADEFVKPMCRPVAELEVIRQDER